ncbi:Fanconi anemia group J protein homolog isoform X2 [Lineus longissimus]|uniref:Fanconi anemia group J protein homolog isoform X2 n=1 Tax=Lineus longissimus TaxID=88925 RepID=UPI00315DD9F3
MDAKLPRTIPIQGVKVQFPFKPYPSQLSMMAKIIKGCGSKQNCLLESPTGTGKSLALLCSALAWQTEFVEKAESGIGKPRDDCCCKCHIKKCTSSPPDSKSGLDNSKYFPDNSSPGPVDVSKCETSLELKPSSDQSEGQRDEDFKDLGKKFRTPVGSISKSKKRTHTPISYEVDQPAESKKISPPPWKMEVTSTRANLPSGADSKDGCCADVDEECMKCDCAENASEKTPVRPPTIFYCTRTHRQIKQITRELGRTAYCGTEMTILSSRDHSCINREVLQMTNRNDGCREKVDLRGCKFYEKSKNITQKVIATSGLRTAWDIEDFKDVCAALMCCPYFSARELKNTARLVFCPYNYLIDPVIRDSMEITLDNQIVILDEAHNIEDFARSAASAEFTEDQLAKASIDLLDMVNENVKPLNHAALKDMVDKIQRVVKDNGQYLKGKGFDEWSKFWSGPELVVMLNRMGLGSENIDALRRHFVIINEEQDQDEVRRKNARGRIVKLPNATMMVLKNLFVVLRFINKEDKKYLDDYRLAIVKKKEWRSGPTDGRWMSKNNRGLNNPQHVYPCTLYFWCMNPAVAFSDLESVRCLVLTSGTLSPLKSFESELGMPFPIQLEANHVIKPNQVLVGTIGKGPKGGQLLASYQKSETFEFQDETGGTILQICRTIPHGVLCFVSSYKMLEKLRSRWQATGLWSDIQDVKSIHCEPRKSDVEDFDEVIKNFYTAIQLSERDSSQYNGALLIAVCRGKVSEGIDFSDNNARAVITIGIPFPSIMDAQVELKRKYNDQHSRRKGLLTGSEWYEIQAYRALNQALGRCIRHRKDWGALILVDERFSKNPKYINGISKWLRSKVTHFQNFPDIRQALSSFAEEMKTTEDLDITSSSPVTDASINVSQSFANTPDVSRAKSNFSSPDLRVHNSAKPKDIYSIFTPTTTKVKVRSAGTASAPAKNLRAKFNQGPQACSTPMSKPTHAEPSSSSQPCASQLSTNAFSNLPAELMKALSPELLAQWNRFLTTIGGEPVFVTKKNDQGKDCYSPAISKDGKLFFIALPPQAEPAIVSASSDATVSPVTAMNSTVASAVTSDTVPAVVNQGANSDGVDQIKDKHTTCGKEPSPNDKEALIVSDQTSTDGKRSVPKRKKRQRGVVYETPPKGERTVVDPTSPARGINANVNDGGKDKKVEAENLEVNDKMGTSTHMESGNDTYTKQSSSMLENDEEKAEEESEIVTKRGRKRRGSSTNKREAKKQNKDLLDQVDNMKKENDLMCQQCRQIVTSAAECGVASFQRETSPSFMLKIGMKSKESYVFDKTHSSLLFKQLETHLANSGLYNCYWSADDGCCVQYMVCKRCNREMTLPIGAQVLAAADGPCRCKVGQIWLSSEAFH